ncbi:MAG: hypothetical protein EOP84_02455 [Verrucomicrobiaceae bacterium]|nr:MAG: hypothetical protein EOP84_02455 [Verrucomicrobiaceae bacterium]
MEQTLRWGGRGEGRGGRSGGSPGKKRTGRAASRTWDGTCTLESCFRGIPAKTSSQPKVIGTQVTGGNPVVTLYSPRTLPGVTATSSVSGSLETWAVGPVPVL